MEQTAQSTNIIKAECINLRVWRNFGESFFFPCSGSFIHKPFKCDYLFPFSTNMVFDLTSKCYGMKYFIECQQKHLMRFSFLYIDKIRTNTILLWEGCSFVWHSTSSFCCGAFLFCRCCVLCVALQAGRKTGIGKWKQDTQRALTHTEQTERMMMMLMKL